MTIERVATFVYVACQLEDKRCGFDLHSIERVVQAVEVTPLHDMPPIITGVVNYRGAVVPIVNMRRWFGLPDRDVVPEDKLVLVHGKDDLLGVVVDNVTDVVEASELDVVTRADERLVPTSNVLRMKDGTIYLRRIEGLLNDVEAGALARARGSQ